MANIAALQAELTEITTIGKDMNNMSTNIGSIKTKVTMESETYLTRYTSQKPIPIPCLKAVPSIPLLTNTEGRATQK